MRRGSRDIALLAVLVIVLVPGRLRTEQIAAPAHREPFERVPTLTVTGQGELEAAPDTATVRLGAEAQAETARGAQDAVNAAMEKVISQIKKAGIPGNAIQTTGLSLSPIYAPQKPGGESEPPHVAGYRASNSIQVEVNNLAILGQVIDASRSSGANRLEGVSFELKDDSKYRMRALQLAGEQAKVKANALAQSLGIKLGPAWKVSEAAINSPRPLYAGRALEKAALAATPVQPGELKVEATVTVEYSIETPRDLASHQ